MQDEYRYHPEVDGLKVNENGTKAFLSETQMEIKVRKRGKHPFHFVYYKGSQISVARLVLECWKGLPDHPKQIANHIDGNQQNFHHSNLEWGKWGGNAKYPSLSPDAEKEILAKLEQGFSVLQIAREHGVSRRTIYNIKNKENA